jgi:hypothetical protein
MSPEVASKVAAVFEAYKACGGKVDHIHYISDPVEAEKVGFSAPFYWFGI